MNTDTEKKHEPEPTGSPKFRIWEDENNNNKLVKKTRIYGQWDKMITVFQKPSEESISRMKE